MPDVVAQDLMALAQAALAAVLGGVVGWEREAAGKGAGLRTNMLACLGAFLFVKVGTLLVAPTLAAWSAMGLPLDSVVPDPTRLVQAIAVGMSFVGAGVVFRGPEGHQVHGLTTAATLLVVAAVGIAVAAERYVLAVGVALLTVVILRALLRFERLAADGAAGK
ncbi:MAG TPA: MgtC/SapB family protein [Rubricoccaceae bacterium]|nr:MgtC/SapB family protein [Rubricoccaceae bacterium]